MKKYKIGNIISKNRYIDYLDGNKLEIDKYSLPFNFLVIEVEFDSVNDANKLNSPDYWFEVTDDKRFKNQSIALMDNLDIQKLNDEFESII